MNSIDILIALPILWGAYKGYKTGFLMTLLSLVAFFLAAFLGLKFFHTVLAFIEPYIELSESWMPVIAFLITFFLIFLIVLKIGRYLKKNIDATLFGSFDQLIGATLGILQLAFIVSTLLWFLSINTLNQEMVEKSKLYTYVAPIAPWVFDHTAHLTSISHDFIEDIKSLLKEKTS